MAKFFIDRPIFAWVIALFIMVLGAVSITQLPIAQYPPVAPPAIVINATYPGASAKTLEDSVLSVIEQEMNGSPGLIYMESSADASGAGSITVTFEPGTDVSIAQIEVQNRLSRATPRLPSAVTQQGVRVDKARSNFLLFVMLSSKNPAYDPVALGDYAARNIQPELLRVAGVGQAQLFGTERALRVWIDPAKLVGYGLGTDEVVAAIRTQNVQVSAGTVGDTPNPASQSFYATVTVSGQFTTVEEFGRILLRANADGSSVRLKDVARIELGGQAYATTSRLNGVTATGIGIQLAPSGNALATAKAVRARMAELQKFMPEGVSYEVPYDSSKFVSISIEQVIHTLAEAIALVFLVMFLFLQNWRYTIIPTIVVPVALMGTFGVMLTAGFSINVLTLFGMVLAIGILVDDAIVVVENVERVMAEEGLPPKEATRKSMGQIQGALVGIAMVLSAVFIPMAFFGGSTGAIYRQFSITIVSAMALSVLVALILTPALCATMLKPIQKGGHGEHKGFFGWFNRMFDKSTHHYTDSVGNILRSTGRYLVLYLIIVVGMAWLFVRLPSSFLPDEDQGRLMMAIQMPAGSSLTRTDAVLREVEDYLAQQQDITEYLTIVGINGDQASANGFIKLKDWGERKGKGQDAASLARRMTSELGRIRDARVFVFLPAAIRGLGSSAGFTVELQDLAGNGHDALVKARDQFLQLARQDKRLAQVRLSGLDDVAQFAVDIDDRKASAMKLATSDINSTLSTALGGTYVNDFIDRSRVKRVYVQGDAPFRMNPEDLRRWHVRNSVGEMVPMTTFASTRWTYGSPRLERYSGMSSYEIVGSAAEGVSSGDAMAAVEEIIKKLPPGLSYEWAGQSYQERLAGSQAPALYAISILFVFLCLAALYESWTIPFSVLLVVPLGVIGAVLATWLVGLENDVYFQIGLLTTVGLSAKNAILIVEFAKENLEKGAGVIEATMHAVRDRLRPIIMTSLAFGLGVLPLAIASGAGSGAQRAIGTGTNR